MARRRDARETRRRLLEAAEVAFTEKGFDGTRVDDIAQRAGVNKRMIYVYFESKEGLYLEVLRGQLAAALEEAEAHAQPEAPPEARVEGIVRWYFDFLADHPNFVRLLGWESLNYGRWSSQAYAQLAEVGLRRLAAVIELGVAGGDFRPDVDVRTLIVAVSGMCVGFFNRRRLMRDLWGVDLGEAEARQRVLDEVLRLLFDGICKREEASR